MVELSRIELLTS